MSAEFEHLLCQAQPSTDIKFWGKVCLILFFIACVESERVKSFSMENITNSKLKHQLT